MKQAAFGLLLISAISWCQAPAKPPAPARPVKATSPAPLPTVGALGGPYASVGISRPLGGIALPGSHPPAKPATTTGYRYVGPVYYVPNAYDYASTAQQQYTPVQTAWQPPMQAAEVPQTAAPPSVVINQYFGSARPSDRAEEAASQPNVEPAPAPTYYLIQFRDRTVRQALAYWVEGNTLHYVTAPNAHNQASLSLIDMETTARLNAGTPVPAAVPER